MGARGSQLQRAVTYFREAPLDEARVAFQLVKETVEARLAEDKTSAKRQVTAVTAPRKRRTKAQMQADKADANPPAGEPGHQTTIQEQAGTVPV